MWTQHEIVVDGTRVTFGVIDRADGPRVVLAGAIRWGSTVNVLAGLDGPTRLRLLAACLRHYEQAVAA